MNIINLEISKEVENINEEVNSPSYTTKALAALAVQASDSRQSQQQNII